MMNTPVKMTTVGRVLGVMGSFALGAVLAAQVIVTAPAGGGGSATTSASDLTSGTLAAARMLNGGVFTGDATTTFPALTVTSIGGKTVTLSGNLTTTGTFNPTFAIPSSSTWTLPSGGGTLAPLISPSFTTPDITRVERDGIVGEVDGQRANIGFGVHLSGGDCRHTQ